MKPTMRIPYLAAAIMSISALCISSVWASPLSSIHINDELKTLVHSDHEGHSTKSSKTDGIEVSITYPADWEAFSESPSNVPVQVSASASQGSITKVELYSGSSMVGETMSAPYLFFMSNLDPGLYRISARAYVNDDYATSDTIPFVVDLAPPTAPTNVIANNIGYNSITLVWSESTDDSGIKEYEVYVNDSLWTTSINTHCIVDELTEETSYNLYVVAKDYAGNSSGGSNEIEVTTRRIKTAPGWVDAIDFDFVEGEVQLDDAQDDSGDQYVGWFDGGEALGYSIVVDETNDYLVRLRIAKNNTPGDIELKSDDQSLTTVTLPNTGGWISWINFDAVVHLEQGPQDFTINNLVNPFNINWFEFMVAILPNEITIENCPTEPLPEGSAHTLAATLSPDSANARNVIWSSSDTLIAKISAEGEFTAVKAGEVTIFASTEYGNKVDSCIITVSPIPPDGITINSCPNEAMETGGTFRFSATVSPENASSKVVVWTSSDASVIAIDSDGLATAGLQGEATITATTESGTFESTCSVTVSSLNSANALSYSQADVVVFPNPTGSGVVTIQGEPLKNSLIRVISMDGRIMKSIQNTSNDKEITLSLDDLTQGIYLVSIISNGATLQKKLIVQ